MSTPSKPVSPKILELSSKIRKDLTKSKDGSSVTQGTNTPYYSNLPEGLTKEASDALDDYRVDFIHAGTHAIGELAVQALSENKDLDDVTGELSIGKYDTLNVDVARSSEFTIRTGGQSKTIHKPGHITVAVDVKGEAKSGEMKRVHNAITELAEKMLKEVK